MSTYASMRQRTPHPDTPTAERVTSAYVSIRQHTSAYVTVFQNFHPGTPTAERVDEVAREQLSGLAI
jgi:hypothetical protein